MRNFLESKGWWDHSKEEEATAEWKSKISKSVKRTEKMLKPPLREMWSDTFGGSQVHLDRQRSESERIIEKWKGYKAYEDELKRFKA